MLFNTTKQPPSNQPKHRSFFFCTALFTFASFLGSPESTLLNLVDFALPEEMHPLTPAGCAPNGPFNSPGQQGKNNNSATQYPAISAQPTFCQSGIFPYLLVSRCFVSSKTPGCVVTVQGRPRGPRQAGELFISTFHIRTELEPNRYFSHRVVPCSRLANLPFSSLSSPFLSLCASLFRVCDPRYHILRFVGTGYTICRVAGSNSSPRNGVRS